MKKARATTSDRSAVKIESRIPPTDAGIVPFAEAELTPDHAAFRQLLGQVADGLDSLQHHLNVFQRAVTASGRGDRARDNALKASKATAPGAEQAR